MLLNVIGALFLVGGCGLVGYYCSMRAAYRTQDLREFKKALLMLASEIEHMRTVLPAACANIAKRVDEPVSKLFEHFSAQLSENEGESAYQLWAQSLDAHKEPAYLAAEDWEEIDGFGKSLGYLDTKMQKNAILNTVSYIDDKVSQLQTLAGKNRRMFRSLGFIGGLLAVAVLWQ